MSTREMWTTERVEVLEWRLAGALENARELEGQLSGCNAEREVAIEAFRDSETERLFWKAAAERALRLWEQVQDDLDALEEKHSELKGRYLKALHSR